MPPRRQPPARRGGVKTRRAAVESRRDATGTTHSDDDDDDSVTNDAGALLSHAGNASTRLFTLASAPPVSHAAADTSEETSVPRPRTEVIFDRGAVDASAGHYAYVQEAAAALGGAEAQPSPAALTSGTRKAQLFGVPEAAESSQSPTSDPLLDVADPTVATAWWQAFREYVAEARRSSPLYQFAALVAGSSGASGGAESLLQPLTVSLAARTPPPSFTLALRKWASEEESREEETAVTPETETPSFAKARKRRFPFSWPHIPGQLEHEAAPQPKALSLWDRTILGRFARAVFGKDAENTVVIGDALRAGEETARGRLAAAYPRTLGNASAADYVESQDDAVRNSFATLVSAFVVSAQHEGGRRERASDWGRYGAKVHAISGDFAFVRRTAKGLILDNALRTAESERKAGMAPWCQGISARDTASALPSSSEAWLASRRGPRLF